MYSRMRKWVSCSVLFFSAAALFAQDGGKGAVVQALGFKYGTGKSTLTIELDKDATFEKNVSEADKQVIIDIKGATIGKKWSRRLDTSQYKSNVQLISPYQSGDV